MNQPKVLIVEDEFLTGADIRSKLIKMGCQVMKVVDSGEAAIDAVQAEKPDLILMDITLSGKMTGIEAAQIIQSKDDIPVIYLTAHTDKTTISKAKETSPFGYLIKPFDERSLQITVEVTLHRHEMERRLKISEERYRSIAELSDDFIMILDRSCTILFINTAAARFIGEKQEFINGKKFGDIVPGDLPEKMIPTIHNVFFYRTEASYT
ncbi:MAG TPA: response regulator [Methanospirillum sp.]|uniref:response regulator n=1 Tax=Methanospirillum sp. TaxID=45200 RepID=UPI002BB8B64C|nr:response regulator [Methanospirillum sp.]HOJ96959.1 response regulator [Methanospirillum sp.]